MTSEETIKETIKETILAEYDSNKALYTTFLMQMGNLMRSLIEFEDVKISSMDSRIKDKESLSKKIDKKQTDLFKGSKKYKYKYNNLKDLTDICGIRICTFYSDDVDKIANIIEKEFTVDTINSIDKRISIEPDKFGYLSLHYIVSLPKNRLNLTENSSFKNIKFEIQIRSMLQHTWAEIEHDLGYKSAEGLPKEIKRDFSRLAGLLEIADKEFLSIRDYLDDYQDKVNKIIQSPLITTEAKDISIDRITLKELVKSDFFIQQFNFITKETGVLFNYSLTDSDGDSLTTAFDFLNILTIKDLKQLLEESNLLLIATIKQEYSDPESVNLLDKTVLFYSLYYKILKESMPAETFKTIYNILNVSANYKERHSTLLELYNIIISK